MKRKNVLRMLVLLTVLGLGTLFQLQANLAPPTPPTAPTAPTPPTLPTAPTAPTPPTPVAPLFALQANSQTFDFFTESIEGKLPTPYTPPEEYDGQQTVRGVMNAFDAEYNRRYSKTRVIAAYEGSIYRSALAISGEIDARYPRAKWLQLLLDKGITIETFDDYRVYLSKRHTLIFLEDNPNFRKADILDISPTDDWETYKAAYIEKLIMDYAKIREVSEQVERTKAQVERAKAQIEHNKAQVEHAKAQIEHNKAQVEHAKAQIEHNKAQVERAKAQIEHNKAQIERNKVELKPIKGKLQQAKPLTPSPKKPKSHMKTKSRYPPL